MRYKNLLVLVLLVISNFAHSQNYYYLIDITLDEPEEFKANETQAIAAINYLISTPVDDYNADRQLCLRFISRYSHTPFIKIPANRYIQKLARKNPDLELLYKGLWIREAINTPASSAQACESIVFRHLYRYIKAGNNVRKSKHTEALIEAGNANAIEAFIKGIK